MIRKYKHQLDFQKKKKYSGLSVTIPLNIFNTSDAFIGQGL